MPKSRAGNVSTVFNTDKTPEKKKRDKKQRYERLLESY